MVSTHYPSNVTADEGGPIYYQQQVLATVPRIDFGSRLLTTKGDDTHRARGFDPRRELGGGDRQVDPVAAAEVSRTSEPKVGDKDGRLTLADAKPKRSQRVRQPSVRLRG